MRAVVVKLKRIREGLPAPPSPKWETTTLRIVLSLDEAIEWRTLRAECGMSGRRLFKLAIKHYLTHKPIVNQEPQRYQVTQPTSLAIAADPADVERFKAIALSCSLTHRELLVHMTRRMRASRNA